MNRKKDNKIRVMAGMSGGVDSSVAAVLLKKQGYDVIGVFLLFTRMAANKCTNRHEYNKCCDYESLLAARVVCDKLKIPFYVLDASKVFKKEVVDYFITEYDSGRTPNPCVRCNKFIKFGWLLEQAKKLSCQFIATGHYARLGREFPISNFQFPNKSKIQNSNLLNYRLSSDVYRLFQAKDKKKDQSYFLWQLDQEQLSHIIFPIGDYTKEEVRRMARKWKLPVAEKKESQDLCFIDVDKADFLADKVDKLNKPGEIVDLEGNILGKHRGLCYYTIGQRHGLGVQLKTLNPRFKILNKSKILNLKSKITGFQPAYVVKLDTENNRLIVGQAKDLYSQELIAKKVNWINSCNMKHVTCNKEFKYQAKIRYGSPLSLSHLVTLSQNYVKVVFKEPQRAITPGQSVVFYQDEELLGGGVIR